VRLQTASDGRLAVRFAIDGDIARLRVPPPRAPRFAERLWEHTCCEVFIARKNAGQYREFNLSPSGEWAAYEFQRYRDGAPLAEEKLEPRIAVRRAPDRLELDAAIDCGAESGSLALAAVIEEQSGALSYWALQHPAARPDFHHPAAFVLAFDEIRD
jgi:hypothetical protein